MRGKNFGTGIALARKTSTISGEGTLSPVAKWSSVWQMPRDRCLHQHLALARRVEGDLLDLPVLAGAALQPPPDTSFAASPRLEANPSQTTRSCRTDNAHRNPRLAA